MAPIIDLAKAHVSRKTASVFVGNFLQSGCPLSLRLVVIETRTSMIVVRRDEQSSACGCADIARGGRKMVGPGRCKSLDSLVFSAGSGRQR